MTPDRTTVRVLDLPQPFVGVAAGADGSTCRLVICAGATGVEAAMSPGECEKLILTLSHALEAQKRAATSTSAVDVAAGSLATCVVSGNA